MDKLEELNRLWAYRLRLANLLAATNIDMQKITNELKDLDYCHECRRYFVGDHVCLPEDTGVVMNEPRASTECEVRAEFLSHVHLLANYWATLPYKSAQERCDGLAFSILSMIDGCNAGLPAFEISLSPHQDDKEYHRQEGENGYEPGMVINDCMLHEMWYK